MKLSPRYLLFLQIICLLLPLPARAVTEAGVVLTFDDIFVDQWHDFFHGSSALGVKATFFVSHWHTLSTQQIDKLRALQAEGHEIGCHGYDDLGVGAQEYNFDPAKTTQFLNDKVLPAISNMQADGFNPTSWSYPSGERDENYDAVIKPYLPNMRTTFASTTQQLAAMDEIFHNESSHYIVLAGDGIDNSYDNELAEIEAALIRAKTHNEILTLYAHRILPDVLPDGSPNPDADHNYGVRASKLFAVIQKARELGLRFYTFEEAFAVGNSTPPNPESNINLSVEGNRVQVRWTGIHHDFIAIVPNGQSEWQAGMAGAMHTQGSSGNIGITVESLPADQEYAAIFYLDGVKVATSLPFVVAGDGSGNPGEDSTPDTFSFTDLSDVTPDTLQTSNTMTVSGINTITAISVQNGEYSINGGIFTSQPGSVQNGDRVAIRHTSASTPFTAINTLLNIGGVTDTFTSITAGEAQPSIIIYREGQRIRLQWENLPNNFIGIVPTDQAEWQPGMAGADTSGDSIGKIGITTETLPNDQEYVAVFYFNGVKVATSDSIVVPSN